MTAADSDEAYATYQAAGLGSRYFLRRSPAGVWSRSALQIAVGFQSNALDAYDADHLVVVGDLGKVYYTANATAASRWVPLYTGSTNNLYGVQMTGPDSWIVVGGNETIVRFTNGGASQSGSYALTNPTVSSSRTRRDSRFPRGPSAALPPTRASACARSRCGFSARTVPTGMAPPGWRTRTSGNSLPAPRPGATPSTTPRRRCSLSPRARPTAWICR